jgi:hypothetical protein
LIRLHFVVEGQTEASFVRDLLGPHLWTRNIVSTSRSIDGLPRRGYQKLKRDLTRWMKEDQNSDARFTTMVDLYALPADFPNPGDARANRDAVTRVRALEAAFADDIGDRRFVPYIQLHEFEALLFSDPDCFAIRFSERANRISALNEIRGRHASPEHIDDGAHTAPSKQILAVFPDYDKRAVGPLVAVEIGIEKIRAECRHFHEWLSILERLDSVTG